MNYPGDAQTPGIILKNGIIRSLVPEFGIGANTAERWLSKPLPRFELAEDLFDLNNRDAL